MSYGSVPQGHQGAPTQGYHPTSTAAAAGGGNVQDDADCGQHRHDDGQYYHQHAGQEGQHLMPEPLGYDPALYATSGLKPEEVEQAEPLYHGEAVTGTVTDDPQQQPVEASRRFIRTGYRDVWALLLFALTVVASIGLAVHNAKDLRSDRLTPDGKRVMQDMKTWLPVALGLGWILSCVLLALMRAFAREFIIIANVLVIAMNLAIAVIGFVQGVLIVAVLFLLIAVLQAVWLYLVRRRIPFAALLLKTSAGLVTRYWGVVVTSWLCLAAGAAYFAVWTLMGAPVLRHFGNAEGTSGDSSGSSSGDGSGGNEGNDVSGGMVAAALGLLLALLWVTQVCANVSHVTSSGVVATWYFFGEARMPRGSIAGASLRRATTTSFGSICFGSLVVAVVKLIYYLVRSAARHSRHQLVACIAVCLVGMIERLLEYFNVYAFTHVAIYGSSYIEAAKQTWRLVKECGWSGYFNDCLVWPVLSLVTFFPAVLSGVAIGFAVKSVLVGVVVYLVVYVVLVLTMRPVYSGVVTQFVCVAEAPDVMQQANPEYHLAVEEATQAMVAE